MRYLYSIVVLGLILNGAQAQTNAAAGAAPVAAGSSYFAGYTVMLADTDESVALLKEMVGPAGKVVYYGATSRLLVYGTAEMHALVASMLKELNVPLRNVRLEVFFNEKGQGSDVGGSVTGGGEVIIGPGGTSYHVNLKPDLHARTEESSGLTRQHILLRSGTEASIKVGEEVPYVETIVNMGRDWGYIHHNVVMRDVGAFLRVKATVLGDTPLIKVTLTPELSGVVDKRSMNIRFTKVATELTIQDGQTISIGSFGQNSEFYSLFLAGIGKTKKSSDLQITLRATVETPAGN